MQRQIIIFTKMKMVNYQEFKYRVKDFTLNKDE